MPSTIFYIDLCTALNLIFTMPYNTHSVKGYAESDTTNVKCWSKRIKRNIATPQNWLT